MSRVLELCILPSAQILDLGTGTGAIALAIASEQPQWLVEAVDKSYEAVLLAQRNCTELQLHNVRVYRSDWFEAVKTRSFDVIASNPPYIDASDIHLNRGDVAFEPRTALVAAESGLADIFYIIDSSSPYLKHQAWLIVEHGCEQGKAVGKRFKDQGFQDIHTTCDLSGNERVTAGRKS